MTNCMVKELLDRGYFCLYFSAFNLFDTLSDYIFGEKSKDEKAELQQDLYSCDLLVIDDLGTERTTSLVTSELFSLLNERDARKKSTIITSNRSLEGLQQIYSDRIFSRITSNFRLLKLSGPDIRKVKKIAKKESEES